MGQKAKTIIERLPTEILLRVFRGLTAEDVLNIIKIPEFGLLKQRNDLMFDIVTGSKDSQALNNRSVLTGVDETLTNRFYLEELRRDTVLQNPGRYDILVFCLSCEEVVKYRRKIMMLLRKYRGYVWYTETDKDEDYDYWRHSIFYNNLEYTLADFLKAGINVFIDNMRGVSLSENSMTNPSLLSARNVMGFSYRRIQYIELEEKMRYKDSDSDEYDSGREEVTDQGPISKKRKLNTGSRLSFYDGGTTDFHGQLKYLSLYATDFHAALGMFSENIKNCPLKGLELKFTFDESEYSRTPVDLHFSERVIDGRGFASTLCAMNIWHINKLENIDLPNLETLTVSFVGADAIFANVSVPQVQRVYIFLNNGSLELKNIYAGGPDHVIEDLKVEQSTWRYSDDWRLARQPWKISGCDWMYHNIKDLRVWGADIFSLNNCNEKCFRKLGSASINLFNVSSSLQLDEFLFPELWALDIDVTDNPGLELPQFKAPKLRGLSVVIGSKKSLVKGFADNHPHLRRLVVNLKSSRNNLKLENVLTNWDNLQNLESLTLSGVEISPRDKLLIPNKLDEIVLYDCFGETDYYNHKGMGYHHELLLYPGTPGQQLTIGRLNVSTNLKNYYGLTIYTPESTFFKYASAYGYYEVEIITCLDPFTASNNSPRDSVQERRGDCIDFE